MPCFAALPCLSPLNHSICTFHKIIDIDKVTITVITTADNLWEESLEFQEDGLRN